MLAHKPPGGPRWPRGQKFTPSTTGAEAARAYRAAVTEARGMGRSGLDTALAAWATALGVNPTDGAVLVELKDKPVGLPDLGRSLEQAGVELTELRAALDRLVKAGLVDLVPPPSQQDKPPPPPPVGNRWN